MKREVADFARLYGAGAAAKKFNIPASVASYYQRKRFMDTVEQQGVCSSRGEGEVVQGPMKQLSSLLDIHGEGEDDTHPMDEDSPSCSTAGIDSAPQLEMEPVPRHGGLNLPPLHHSHHNHGNNHDGSSTAGPFLRGRGRGRPKLIGDGLDSELVDYMVELKRASGPNTHLTASQALHIAKQYVMEKAPGLLEEYGGSVRLRLTWAMKLVARVAERERELQMQRSGIGGTLGDLLARGQGRGEVGEGRTSI